MIFQPWLRLHPKVQWHICFSVMIAVYALLNAYYRVWQAQLPYTLCQVIQSLVMLVLIGAFGLGAFALHGLNWPKRTLWVSGITLIILTGLMPAFHSDDLYGYINRGWEQSHYHLDPYVAAINHIPHWRQDAMLTNHWVFNPSPYGFGFMLLARAITFLSVGSKGLAVVLFKSINAIVILLSAQLVYLMACRSKLRQPVLAVYLFMCHPLILLHSMANGHNDILMGLSLLLSVWLGMCGLWLGVVPALIVGVLIKYSTLILVPFATLWIGHTKGWMVACGSLLLGFLLWGIAAVPYIQHAQQVHLYTIGQNAFVRSYSVQSMLYALFKCITKFVIVLKPYRPVVDKALQVLFWLAGSIVYIRRLIDRAHERQINRQDYIYDAVFVMVLLIVGISSKFYAWYIATFFPLALLLPSQSRLRRFILWLSIGQLFAFTGLGRAKVANTLVMTCIPLALAWLRQPKLKLPKAVSTGN